MNIFEQSYLLISFYPGTPGFTLSKWLCREKLAVGLNTSRINPDQIDIDNTSNNFVPAFADVVLRYVSDREKIVYQDFTQQIEIENADVDHLKLLLGTGSYHPIHVKQLPYIILTHSASDTSFLNWRGIFPNIKILKIVCNTKSQFETAYSQTYGNLEYIDQQWDLYNNGFVSSSNEDIVISMDDITTLNLNHLKGMV